MARNDPQINVRLPGDLRDRITELAKKNKRSMNSEIVDALERHLDRECGELVSGEELPEEMDQELVRRISELVSEVTRRRGK